MRRQTNLYRYVNMCVEMGGDFLFEENLDEKMYNVTTWGYIL